MRYWVLCCLLTLLTLVSNAQSLVQQPGAKPPCFTGQLLHYDTASDGVPTLKWVLVTPSPQGQAEYFGTVEADGSFHVRLPHALRRQQIWFTLGDYYYGQLMLSDSLHIAIDLDGLRAKQGYFHSDYVQFSGPDAELTDYLNAYTDFRRSHPQNNNGEVRILMDRKMSRADKWKALQPDYAVKRKILAAFAKKHPSPYAALLKQQLQSTYYSRYLMLLSKTATTSDSTLQVALAHRPRTISNSAILDYYRSAASYYQHLPPARRLQVYREKLLPKLTDAQWSNKLEQLIDWQQQLLRGASVADSLVEPLRAEIEEQFADEIWEASISYMIEQLREVPAEQADLIKLSGGGTDLWRRERYVERVLPTVRHEVLAGILRSRWEKEQKQLLAARERLSSIEISSATTRLGQQVGRFDNGAELILAEGDSIEPFLASLRASVDEKPLLLDIWATWCKPCLIDMEEATDNIQALREKGVEVVYLCSSNGSTPEQWQQRLAEFELPTKHIFLNDTLSEQVMRYFNLRGYPSHIFIDGNGKALTNRFHSVGRIDLPDVDKLLRK